MNELISIIINVYNGEKYIRQCLESVINQTYRNIEILVVNDGSTDSTLRICEEFKDKRIRIISTENKGLSLSRNVGIDNAKGKYLYFVDCDDLIEKDVIEYLYGLVRKYKLQIATCNYMYIYNYDFIVLNEKEQIIIKEPKEMIKEILFLKGRSGTIWNKLIEKSLFDNIRFEDRIVNDVAVVYKLYMNTDKIVYSNQIKYYYLRHSDSIEALRKKERTIDMYTVSIERYYYIKKAYPDFYENDIGMLLMIFNIYYRDYEKLHDFFKKEKLKKIYNKFFSLKLLKCDLSRNCKLKLILFRISPKLSKYLTKMYLNSIEK